MSDGEPLLALALGIGAGLILAYVRRHDGEPDRAPPPARPPPTPTTPVEPEAAGGTGTGACSLRLDGTGLTADGHRVDLAGAVARCKKAGRAELFVSKDGPASLLVDLCRALANGRVRVAVWGG